MRFLCGVMSVLVCAGAAGSVAAASSLTCDGGTFSAFRVKNTKARNYRSLTGSECALTQVAEGVIWVATGEGFALKDPAKKLSFTNEQGKKFGQTCWTSTGTINDVVQTELILFGPADTKSVKTCCGSSCVDAQVE